MLEEKETLEQIVKRCPVPAKAYGQMRKEYPCGKIRLIGEIVFCKIEEYSKCPYVKKYEK